MAVEMFPRSPLPSAPETEGPDGPNADSPSPNERPVERRSAHTFVRRRAASQPDLGSGASGDSSRLSRPRLESEGEILFGDPELASAPYPSAPSTGDLVSRPQAGSIPDTEEEEEALFLEPPAPEARPFETAPVPESLPARSDSVLKPYATLSAPPKSPSLAPTGDRFPPAPRSSDFPSAAQSGERAQSERARTTASRAPDSLGGKRKLGTCQKHGISKNPEGLCLLCEKERESRNAARIKIPVAAWIVAGSVAALAAAYLLL